LLEVILQSRAYAGEFTKRIQVSSNDADHVNELLTCKGEVYVPCFIEPRNARFTNKITTDSPTQYQTITITRGHAGPLAPELVPFEEDSWLDAQLCEIEEGEHYELVVSAGPPWQPGRKRKTIYVQTGVEEYPEMRIFATAVVTEP